MAAVTNNKCPVCPHSMYMNTIENLKIKGIIDNIAQYGSEFILDCGHRIHETCVQDRWSRHKVLCPVCKTLLSGPVNIFISTIGSNGSLEVPNGHMRTTIGEIKQYIKQHIMRDSDDRQPILFRNLEPVSNSDLTTMSGLDIPPSGLIHFVYGFYLD